MDPLRNPTVNLFASLRPSLRGEPNFVLGLLSDRSSFWGAALLARRDVVVVVAASTFFPTPVFVDGRSRCRMEIEMEDL